MGQTVNEAKVQPVDKQVLASQRRRFLKFSASAMALMAGAPQLAGCGGGGSSSPAPPMPGVPPETDEAAAFHLVKRTSFGVRQDSLAQALDAPAVYLEEQLVADPRRDSQLEADIAQRFPLVGQTAAQLYFANPPFPANIAAISLQMSAATQYRQLYSQNQLYEIMVEFWSDHFSIHLTNGLGPVLKPTDDREVIRPHALGTFSGLLRASAHSPAMLFYLDNYFNLAASPNENYARELMELHTLGVDGGYSEQDIKEVARCFTGWSLAFPDAGALAGTFEYRAEWHDTGAKTVLGMAIAAGGQQQDGEQVLELLARHPSTARFISTKLCRRFIADSPPQQAIEAVTRTFIDSDGDIRQCLRTLFATDAFANSHDSKFARPAEFLGQLMRSFHPDGGYPRDNGQLFFFIQYLLGQLPFNWPTPDGYPDRADYWANTGGLLNRWRLSFISLSNQLPELDAFDIDYLAMLDGADSREQVLRAMEQHFLMRPLSGGDRAALLQWLAQVSPGNQPLDAATAELLSALLAAVLISSPYFQRR